MVNAYKKLDNYESIKDNIYMRAKKGESITMGTLVDILLAEGKAEGKEEGKAEGGNLKVYELVSEGLITAEQGASNLNISVEQLKSNMLNTGYQM